MVFETYRDPCTFQTIIYVGTCTLKRSPHVMRILTPQPLNSCRQLEIQPCTLIPSSCTLHQRTTLQPTHEPPRRRGPPPAWIYPPPSSPLRHQGHHSPSLFVSRRIASHHSPFASPFRRGRRRARLSSSITCFVLPDNDFTALVRRITITNTSANALSLAALNGLAMFGHWSHGRPCRLAPAPFGGRKTVRVHTWTPLWAGRGWPLPSGNAACRGAGTLHRRPVVKPVHPRQGAAPAGRRRRGWTGRWTGG